MYAMTRILLSQGARYLRNGQVYLVHEVLPGGRLRVRNQSFGGELIVARDDLYTAWLSGELRFAVSGSKAATDEPLMAEDAVASLSECSDWH